MSGADWSPQRGEQESDRTRDRPSPGGPAVNDYPGEEWAESHESRARETGVSEVFVSWAFRGWSLSYW